MKTLKLETVVVALGVLLVGILLVEEAPRIMFPWDWRMFSESPLLTNMMKLTAGQGVYAPAADANSYIYAPGLEYITYATLRPFGAQLDIRACRAVTVAIGGSAAYASGWIASRLAMRTAPELNQRAVRVTTTAIAALVLFKNYTSDACHPDNLYALHAMLVIALTYKAVDSGKLGYGIVALSVAALGLIVKQTAILGFVGVSVVLTIYCRRTWGLLRLAGIIALGGACVAVVFTLAFGTYGRLWAFNVNAHQPVQLFRAYRLIGNVLDSPQRALLYAAVAPSALYLAMRGEAQKLVVAWAAVGVTEVLPALASYFKLNGYWNNLVIIDLWAAMVVTAAVSTVVFASDGHSVSQRAIGGGFLATLFIAVAPMRDIPTHAQYEFGRAVDAAVASDKAQGKRVLLSAGVAPLVHNELLTPPLDCSSSTSELSASRLSTFVETKSRIEKHEYGAIYLFGWESPGYPPAIQSMIDANYHEVRKIDGDESEPLDSDRRGVMNMMHNGVRILEPNP